MALQQSSELLEVFQGLYRAFERGDAAAALDLTSREEGVLSIGTDPGEWWSDYATLERVYYAQLGEMADLGMRIERGEPRCYQEGSVGWCADRARFVLPDGTEIPVRMTMVFHQEDGAWKIVQAHASIGVQNTEAVGRDLTT